MLGRIRVAGHSMEPALHHGDELILLRIPPQVGSVVVARDPRDEDRLLVKRVTWISRDELFLDSDAPGHESVVVRKEDLLGRAIFRYRSSLLPSRPSGQRYKSANAGAGVQGRSQ